MDMTMFDKDELDALRLAGPGDTQAKVKFALHVHALLPLSPFLHMARGEHAVTAAERHLHMAAAAETAFQQMTSAKLGTLAPEMDDNDVTMARVAMFSYACLSARKGLRQEAGVAIARLLEFDPDDSMGVVEMACSLGIFPKRDVRSASDAKM